MVSLGTGQESYFMMDYGLNGFEHMVAGKKVSQAPKIQRTISPLALQRKRARIANKKMRIAKAKS